MFAKIIGNEKFFKLITTVLLIEDNDLKNVKLHTHIERCRNSFLINNKKFESLVILVTNISVWKPRKILLI